MAIGDNFQGLANNLIQQNSPNVQRQREQEARQFQQEQQLRSAQMQQQQKAQQFQMLQQLQAQQQEQQQTKFENQRQVAKDMLSADTPEGVAALSQLYGNVLPPQQIMAMQNAALGFQKKQVQEKQDAAMEGKGFFPTPPGVAGVSSISPQDQGQTVVNDRPYSPIPSIMNPLQQSEINKNNALANKANSPGGNMGQPAGNDAKNALWAKQILAAAKQNPRAVDPQTLEVAKQIDETSSLTPEATDLYADMAIQSGTLPGGFGMAKVRTAVMNKVGEASKTLGVGPGDIIANGAAFVANKGALNKLTSQKAQIDTFSDFTDRQLSTLGQTLNVVKDKLSGTPLFNKPIISWGKNVTGDPAIQAYLQQLQSTKTEVARLVAGLAASGGAVPITFEKEWDNILSDKSSPAQVEAFINQAGIEKSNRQKAFDKGQADLLEKISKNPDPARAQKFLNQMSGQSDQQQTTDFPGDGIMPTIQELEQAEQQGNIGPKSKAFLDQYRSSQTTSGGASNAPTRQTGGSSGPIGQGIAQSQSVINSGAGAPITPIRQFAIPRPSPEFQKAHPTLSGMAIGGSKLAEYALSPSGAATAIGMMAAPEFGIPARALALGGAAFTAPQIASSIVQGIQSKDPEQKAENFTKAAGMGLMAGGALRQAGRPMGAFPEEAIGMAAKNEAANSADVDSMIANKFTKAVRPSVVGKSNASDIEAYNSRAVDAVKSIVSNKGNLQLVDKFGEPSGQLPTTLHEFTQAVEQTKKSVFDQYNAKQAQAGKAGAVVDLKPIAAELRKVAADPVVTDFNKSTAAAATELAESLEARGTYDPARAQAAIADLNQKLEAYYKNPTPSEASISTVRAMVANRLRSGLDDSITKSTEPGYQELKNKYGALASIEKDVAHRAIVDARRNQKGLLDYTDIASASDVIRGLATGNPADLAAGAVKKGVAEYLKFRNNPNSIVKSMFYGADKQYGQ